MYGRDGANWEVLMILAKPIENFAGITLEGDHEDFYEKMESI